MSLIQRALYGPLLILVYIAGASSFGPRPSYIAGSLDWSQIPFILKPYIFTDSISSLLIGRISIVLAIICLSTIITLRIKEMVLSFTVVFVMNMLTVYSTGLIRYVAATQKVFFLLEEVKLNYIRIFATSIFGTLILYIIPAMILMIVNKQIIAWLLTIRIRSDADQDISA